MSVAGDPDPERRDIERYVDAFNKYSVQAFRAQMAAGAQYGYLQDPRQREQLEGAFRSRVEVATHMLRYRREDLATFNLESHYTGPLRNRVLVTGKLEPGGDGDEINIRAPEQVRNFMSWYNQNAPNPGPTQRWIKDATRFVDPAEGIVRGVRALHYDAAESDDYMYTVTEGRPDQITGRWITSSKFDLRSTGSVYVRMMYAQGMLDKAMKQGFVAAAQHGSIVFEGVETAHGRPIGSTYLHVGSQKYSLDALMIGTGSGLAMAGYDTPTPAMTQHLMKLADFASKNPDTFVRAVFEGRPMDYDMQRDADVVGSIYLAGKEKTSAMGWAIYRSLVRDLTRDKSRLEFFKKNPDMLIKRLDEIRTEATARVNLPDPRRPDMQLAQPIGISMNMAQATSFVDLVNIAYKDGGKIMLLPGKVPDDMKKGMLLSGLTPNAMRASAEQGGILTAVMAQYALKANPAEDTYRKLTQTDEYKILATVQQQMLYGQTWGYSWQFPGVDQARTHSFGQLGDRGYLDSWLILLAKQAENSDFGDTVRGWFGKVSDHATDRFNYLYRPLPVAENHAWSGTVRGIWDYLDALVVNTAGFYAVTETFARTINFAFKMGRKMLDGLAGRFGKVGETAAFAAKLLVSPFVAAGHFARYATGSMVESVLVPAFGTLETLVGSNRGGMFASGLQRSAYFMYNTEKFHMGEAVKFGFQAGVTAFHNNQLMRLSLAVGISEVFENLAKASFATAKQWRKFGLGGVARLWGRVLLGRDVPGHMYRGPVFVPGSKTLGLRAISWGKAGFGALVLTLLANRFLGFLGTRLGGGYDLGDIHMVNRTFQRMSGSLHPVQVDLVNQTGWSGDPRVDAFWMPLMAIKQEFWDLGLVKFWESWTRARTPDEGPDERKVREVVGPQVFWRGKEMEMAFQAHMRGDRRAEAIFLLINHEGERMWRDPTNRSSMYRAWVAHLSPAPQLGTVVVGTTQEDSSKYGTFSHRPDSIRTFSISIQGPVIFPVGFGFDLPFKLQLDLGDKIPSGREEARNRHWVVKYNGDSGFASYLAFVWMRHGVRSALGGLAWGTAWVLNRTLAEARYMTRLRSQPGRIGWMASFAQDLAFDLRDTLDPHMGSSVSKTAPTRTAHLIFNTRKMGVLGAVGSLMAMPITTTWWLATLVPRTMADLVSKAVWESATSGVLGKWLGGITSSPLVQALNAIKSSGQAWDYHTRMSFRANIDMDDMGLAQGSKNWEDKMGLGASKKGDGLGVRVKRWFQRELARAVLVEWTPPPHHDPYHPFYLSKSALHIQVGVRAFQWGTALVAIGGLVMAFMQDKQTPQGQSVLADFFWKKAQELAAWSATGGRDGRNQSQLILVNTNRQSDWYRQVAAWNIDEDFSIGIVPLPGSRALKALTQGLAFLIDPGPGGWTDVSGGYMPLKQLAAALISHSFLLPLSGRSVADWQIDAETGILKLKDPKKSPTSGSGVMMLFLGGVRSALQQMHKGFYAGAPKPYLMAGNIGLSWTRDGDNESFKGWFVRSHFWLTPLASLAYAEQVIPRGTNESRQKILHEMGRKVLSLAIGMRQLSRLRPLRTSQMYHDDLNDYAVTWATRVELERRSFMWNWAKHVDATDLLLSGFVNRKIAQDTGQFTYDYLRYGASGNDAREKMFLAMVTELNKGLGEMAQDSWTSGGVGDAESIIGRWKQITDARRLADFQGRERYGITPVNLQRNLIDNPYIQAGLISGSLLLGAAGVKLVLGHFVMAAPRWAANLLQSFRDRWRAETQATEAARVWGLKGKDVYGSKIPAVTFHPMTTEVSIHALGANNLYGALVRNNPGADSVVYARGNYKSILADMPGASALERAQAVFWKNSGNAVSDQLDNYIKWQAMSRSMLAGLERMSAKGVRVDTLWSTMAQLQRLRGEAEKLLTIDGHAGLKAQMSQIVDAFKAESDLLGSLGIDIVDDITNQKSVVRYLGKSWWKKSGLHDRMRVLEKSVVRMSKLLDRLALSPNAGGESLIYEIGRRDSPEFRNFMINEVGVDPRHMDWIWEFYENDDNYKALKKIWQQTNAILSRANAGNMMETWTIRMNQFSMQALLHDVSQGLDGRGLEVLQKAAGREFDPTTGKYIDKNETRFADFVTDLMANADDPSLSLGEDGKVIKRLKDAMTELGIAHDLLDRLIQKNVQRYENAGKSGAFRRTLRAWLTEGEPILPGKGPRETLARAGILGAVGAVAGTGVGALFGQPLAGMGVGLAAGAATGVVLGRNKGLPSVGMDRVGAMGALNVVQWTVQLGFIMNDAARTAYYSSLARDSSLGPGQRRMLAEEAFNAHSEMVGNVAGLVASTALATALAGVTGSMLAGAVALGPLGWIGAGVGLLALFALDVGAFLLTGYLISSFEKARHTRDEKIKKGFDYLGEQDRPTLYRGILSIAQGIHKDMEKWSRSLRKKHDMHTLDSKEEIWDMLLHQPYGDHEQPTGGILRQLVDVIYNVEQAQRADANSSLSWKLPGMSPSLLYAGQIEHSTLWIGNKSDLGHHLSALQMAVVGAEPVELMREMVHETLWGYVPGVKQVGPNSPYGEPLTPPWLRGDTVRASVFRPPMMITEGIRHELTRRSDLAQLMMSNLIDARARQAAFVAVNDDKNDNLFDPRSGAGMPPDAFMVSVVDPSAWSVGFVQPGMGYHAPPFSDYDPPSAAFPFQTGHPVVTEPGATFDMGPRTDRAYLRGITANLSGRSDKVRSERRAEQSRSEAVPPKLPATGAGVNRVGLGAHEAKNLNHQQARVREQRQQRLARERAAKLAAARDGKPEAQAYVVVHDHLRPPPATTRQDTLKSPGAVQQGAVRQVGRSANGAGLSISAPRAPEDLAALVRQADTADLLAWHDRSDTVGQNRRFA